MTRAPLCGEKNACSQHSRQFAFRVLPGSLAFPQSTGFHSFARAGELPAFPVLRLSQRRAKTSTRPRNSERNSRTFSSLERVVVLVVAPSSTAVGPSALGSMAANCFLKEETRARRCSRSVWISKCVVLPELSVQRVFDVSRRCYGGRSTMHTPPREAESSLQQATSTQSRATPFRKPRGSSGRGRRPRASRRFVG